ncbi:MAG TPA: polyhydroxyalkanoate synthesis regulator DNA-binding domain-containing protein [Gemmatimonadaceae bacterium]|nr:polyhydroxyalkanoate synthesis regulator DNA-binding domain-containing protein [Gemmatimonadaceae bacterium]
MTNAPRVIRRYGNRKLYDVRASAYVSMTDIARLIREGHTVQVIDNVSGEDITAQTLTQVVLEQGRQGREVVHTDLLHQLLRRGGQALDAGVEQFRHGVDELVQGSIGRITRVVQGPQERELRQLREQIASLESTLAELLDRREQEEPALARRPRRTAASRRKKTQ